LIFFSCTNLKRIRHACTLILTAVFLLSLPLHAKAETEDPAVFSPWAADILQDAYSLYALFPQTGEKQDFTRPVTGAEFTAMLETACGIIAGQYAAFGCDPPPALSAGEAMTVSRESAAELLCRAAQHFGIPTDFPAPVSKEQPSDAPNIYTAYCMGLFLGNEHGELEPHRPITREESAAVCIRLILSAPLSPHGFALSPESTYRYNGNFFWDWLEDGEDRVLSAAARRCRTHNYRSDWGADSVSWFLWEGRIARSVLGSTSPGENSAVRITDALTDEVLLTLPEEAGWFYAVAADGKHLIFSHTRYSFPSVDSAYSVYAVFAPDGRAVLPPGSLYKDLTDGGWLIP